MEDPNTYNLFVTLLDGKTLTLKLRTPTVSAASIKRRLFEVTRIPLPAQRLLTGTLNLRDTSVISHPYPTVRLVGRLAGGKGGFGSLLRGAASKAGFKKTSNFDACRDMSGRRLRHVNAENKMQEWKDGEEQRKLEKIGEDYLKSRAKKGKKGSGDAAAQKYVEKYREESERCVAAVAEAVREAVERKRKGTQEVPKSKRRKIWMGEIDSDSEGDDSDIEDEKEKSTVSNDGNNSDANKEAEGSLDSVNGRKQDGETSGGGSCESGSEGEKEIIIENDLVEVIHDGKLATSTSVPCSAPDTDVRVEAIQDEKMDCNATEMGNPEVVDQPQISNSGDEQGVKSTLTVSEVNVSLESNPVVQDEAIANKIGEEKALNFDEFASAADMEVLGLEKLKYELQARGLKCGGTLKERAARLFMLKSTPIEKIPKKLLAKK